MAPPYGEGGEAEAYDEERQWAHELAIQNAALLNWLGAMVREPLIREIQRFGIRSQPFVWRRISIFSGVGE